MSILVATPDGQTAEFPDGTDPATIQKAMAQQFGGPDHLKQSRENIAGDNARLSPAEGSFMGNLPAAIGSGMTDAVAGLDQLIAHENPAFKVWDALSGKTNPITQKLDQYVTEKAKTDAPLKEAPGGSTGNLIGNIAALAPLGAAGKIGPALQGAIAGASQPVANVGTPSVGDLVSGNQPVNYDAALAKNAGVGAATGYVADKAIKGALNLANKVLNPTATLANAAAGKAANSDFAKEGEALAQRTGIDLTPGQITGSKTQTSLENLARQSIFSRQQAFDADQKIIQQWTDHVQNTLDGIASGGGSPAEVGQRVQGTIKSAVQNLSQTREAAANADYGQIRSLLQGKPAVIPQNYMQKLAELGQEYAGGPEGSDYAKLAKTIGSLQENGLQNADLTTLMKTRRFLSQVAGGQVNLAGDTGKGLQKSVAAQLLGAIDQDLDASAQKIGGPVGQMLQAANARYRGFSQQIEGLQKSALGKLVGEDLANAVGSGTSNQIPGEAVMQRLSAMKPSEIASAKAVLADPQIGNPEVWQQVKRGFLESALEKAQSAAPSEGANALAARPNVFVNAIAKTPQDKARLAALFEPGELSSINDAMAAARRISDKTGINFSGTAQAAEGYGIAHALGSALTGNVKPLAGVAGGAITGRGIASVMANSQGRALVMQLDRLPPGSARFGELAAKLAAIAAAQDANSEAGASQ